MLVIVNHGGLTAVKRNESLAEFFIGKVAIKEFKVIFKGFSPSLTEVTEGVQKCVVPIMSTIGFIAREKGLKAALRECTSSRICQKIHIECSRWEIEHVISDIL